MRSMYILRGTLLSAFVLAATAKASEVQAQSTSGTDPIVLPRLTGPITLDGVPDEAAWEAIPPLPLVTYEPNFGADPTERTELRVAYDDNYLYVGGRFYDSEPSGIRINSLYRDRWSGDDTFGLVVDSYNDNENGLMFWASPAGVRGDIGLSNDAEGGFANFNPDWNTHWDAVGKVTDEGWFGEMRIPFSSLGFQETDGRVVIGFTVYRLIGRKNERHIYPEIPPDWSFRKPSLTQDAVLESVNAHNPVYFTPYVLGGVGQSPALNDAGSFTLEDSLIGEVGGDLKYNVTSNLTLDLSVNTDFAQVEADDQQVNLGRVPLFFPEKRQFFQERSGTFEFNTGGIDRLFHSRRIGLIAGEQIRIYGGARIVGRVGSWDVGVLNMQTAASTLRPSENFGVLRLRRQVLNPYSYAGGMVTSRIGTDGSYNIAYGLDGIFRLFGDEFLTLKWGQTFDDSLITRSGFRFGEAAVLYAQWERRREQGFSYNAYAKRYGADYRPLMGFITRLDVTELFGTARYNRFLPEAAFFRRFSPSQLAARAFLRNRDGSVQTAVLAHRSELEWKSGANAGLNVDVNYENLRVPLPLPENTLVPPGSYWFPRLTATYSMAQGDLLRSDVNVGFGGFYDGWRIDGGVSPRWNVSRFVELSAEYQLNVVRFPDREAEFTVHVGRVRTQFALNTKASMNAFLQYDTGSDIVSANVRLRYNFREGNDLWIVYNEGVNAERQNRLLPRTDNRTFMIKYTYTFTW